MRKVYLFIILWFISKSLYAQSAYIHGNVLEGFGRQPVSNASIVLIGGKDSILLKYSRTDSSGNFTIPVRGKGKFIIMISYPTYADVVDTFSVVDSNNGRLIELGTYKINSEIHLLQEVIVKQRKRAIVIKGDTTEFTADSFYVKPGENVEELLKKLPGFKIDKSGNVTVQGSSVKHIYVDGEEFFGNDPTLVTQNLRADMVDKVQLYDKKSEQAAFSGIDDGKRQKTVNLKLKRNRNTGLFGKLDQGGGPDGYYKSQSMINFFADKYKASAFLNLGNTGVVGLGSQDQSKYGISEDGTIGDDGVYYVDRGGSDGLDTWDGKYDGKGRPTAASGGLYYNAKSADERLKINSNYKLGSLETRDELASISEWNLPNGNLVNRSITTSRNKLQKNSLAVSGEYMLDSSSSIKVNVSGAITDKNEFLESSGQSERVPFHEMLNTNFKSLGIDSRDRSFSSSQLYKKKLGKVRRTFSIAFRESFDNKRSEALLSSKNVLFNSSGPQDSIVGVNQQKSNNEQLALINTKMVYSEPLSKRSTLSFGIDFGYDHELSDRISTNVGSGNPTIDSLGTNRFGFIRNTWKSGLAYNYKYKKLNIQIGSDIGRIVYRQENPGKSNGVEKQWTRIFPQSNLTYSFSSQENLTFSYIGVPQNPTLYQLQPAVINIDPLNIVRGNTELAPSFDHSISGLYINYKVRTSETYFVNAGFHFVDNPIVQASQISSGGVSAYTYVNLPGTGKAYDWSGRALYRTMFKNTPYSIDLNGNFSYYVRTNLTNDQDNEIKSKMYSFSPTLYFSKDKIIDFDLTPLIQYNSFISSLDPLHPYNYWSYSLTGSATTDAVKGFRIQTDLAFNLRGRVNSFDRVVKYTVWNVSIRRYLYKNILALNLTANDILDQNLGNDRLALANGVSQITYHSIKRYFLLSLV
jgi:hypothetical protein